MLKAILKHIVTHAMQRWRYDASYAQTVIDAGAGLAYVQLQGLSTWRRNLPDSAYFAAKILATRAEDCGPCTQLAVDMALAAGVPADGVAALLRGQPDDPAMALASAYTLAVLHHQPAEDLRAQIIARWGPPGLVSIAFAIASGRLYPTLKYALGHGQSCQRVALPDGTELTLAA